MAASPKKPSNDTKTGIDFDTAMLDKVPETYERNLIAALIHSHKLFIVTDGVLCPWDSARGVRRPDFGVSRFNVLYEAISTYWGPMATKTVSPDPIPQSQLNAILVDWSNNGRVATDMIEKLLIEVDEDFYSMNLTDDYIEHGIMGKNFDHWLSTRLSKRVVDELYGKSRQRTVTFEECQAVVQHYQTVQLTAQEKTRAASQPRDRNLWDLSTSLDIKEDPDELLKMRYLGRGGGLLLVGSTGIGKSTFAMQCAVLWALGKPAFGIEPRAVLKSLIIQAENDDADMAEMFNGACAGLQLEEGGKKTAGEQIIVLREDATAGPDFFAKAVRPMLAKHRPDLLWIDPALAYLGGEAKDQHDVGNFLRTLLNPLIREFKCAAVVLHHTNKPPTGKDASTWSNSDFAYAGSGSIEWANWARAVLVLRPFKGSPVFELMAAKRGGRLGWKLPDGETKSYSKFIAHSKVQGQLYWRDANPSEMPGDGNSSQSDELTVLDLVPEDGDIAKTDLLNGCNDNDLPDRRARHAIKRLLEAKKLVETVNPRSTGPGERRISRIVPPSPPQTTAVVVAAANTSTTVESNHQPG